MNGRNLQKTVLDELEWDPSINAAHIGVTANAGVVTLSGNVPRWSDRYTAEYAAWSAPGVMEVGDMLTVA